MKQLIPLVMLLLFCLTPVMGQEETPDAAAGSEASSQPFGSVTMDDLTLDLFFDRIPQGRAALLRVQGEGIAGARLRFFDAMSEFFLMGDGYWYALLAVNMDQAARVYDFSVLVWLEDGTRITIPAQAQVVLGGFIRQDDLSVPPDRAYLVDPEVERLEFARLDAVLSTITQETLWETDFQYPITSEITSPFGAFRTFNQTVQTRHTGWDMRAPTGTPVAAAAAGRVAFAGLLDIRGNHIIIDHGHGIYTGYSHLSQVHVTRGQSILQGQIIGVSGNTGRSGGAHLHFEVSVNGQWVDSVDFMEMWLPSTTP